MTDGRTHYEGCWRDPGHHECAVRRIEEMEPREEELLARIEELEREVRFEQMLVGPDAIAKVEAERDNAVALERLQNNLTMAWVRRYSAQSGLLERALGLLRETSPQMDGSTLRGRIPADWLARVAALLRDAGDGEEN